MIGAIDNEFNWQVEKRADAMSSERGILRL